MRTSLTTQPPTDVLGDLLGATFDFTALVLLFAFFAALLVVALLELGLRRRINTRVYTDWWDGWQKTFKLRDDVQALEHARAFDPKHAYVFSLPYRQLTAAFARNARAQLDKTAQDIRDARDEIARLNAKAEPSKDDAARIEQLEEEIATMTTGERQAVQVQEDSTTLQQRLGHVWFRRNYLLSLLMALLIGGIIYITPNKFDPGAGIAREVAFCSSASLEGDGPPIAGPIGVPVPTAAVNPCPPGETPVYVTSYLDNSIFLILAICFCAALVAPILVDQMERRLLLR